MALLDRYDQIQRRPLGTNTALSDGSQYGVGGSDGSQLRKQESAYGRALRILDRQARRGDANSALGAIKVRNEANAAGFSPGGIRNKAEADAGILGRLSAMDQAAQRRNRTQSLLDQRTDETLAGSAMLGNEDIAANAAAAEDSAMTTELGQDAIDPGMTRDNAALDMLEGRYENNIETGDMSQYNRGLATAEGLGIENPEAILEGDTDLTYRRTLDSALGQARTPGQIASLRERGTRFGVPVDAFNARAKWWETNRRRP